MSIHTVGAVLVKAVGIIILTLLPLADAEGTLWLLAAVTAATVYEGARSSVVYGALAVVLFVEFIYGADIGVSSLGYVSAVVVYLIARRFVSISAWSTQEGWHPVDAIRAFVLGFILYVVSIVSSICIGNILFGYGNLILRLEGLRDVHAYIVPMGICIVTMIALRRMAMPFRREILFGL